MLGHFLRTFLGNENFSNTRATLKRTYNDETVIAGLVTHLSTLTPSHKNMSQTLRTDGQGRVLEKMQRNHSVM